jgi:dihydroneopterin aldolase
VVEDRVVLTGLRLVGRHGVTEAERADPQDFRVDIECPVDVRAAAASDDIGATLDYRRLRDCAAAVIGGPSRHLVETLAEDLASRVLAEAGCAWVRVRVTKLRPGSIEGEATVEVRRPRAAAGSLVGAVELHVPAFAPVKEFYGRLGFTVAREEIADSGEGYLVLQRGPNVLRFWPGSDAIDRHEHFGSFPRSTRRGYGVEIVIVVEDVDAVYAAARAFARIVSPLRERSWGLRDFRLEDPFGYYVRVTELHDPLAAARS